MTNVTIRAEGTDRPNDLVFRLTEDKAGVVLEAQLNGGAWKTVGSFMSTRCQGGKVFFNRSSVREFESVMVQTKDGFCATGTEADDLWLTN